MLKIAAPDKLELAWESKVMKNQMSGCVHYEGHLYGVDGSTFKCIDLDGKEKWAARTGNGAFVLADGKLLILTDRGDLVIAPAKPDKFEELSLIQRLERRNSISVEFPEIGLGPRFRLTVEGLDVRDNSRDFGITKDAALLTLLFRYSRQFSAQLGGSLELNDASIFGQEQKGALEDYVRKFSHMRFEPQGYTKNPDIRIAKSLIDYIFRWLGITFLPGYKEASLGVVPAGNLPR